MFKNGNIELLCREVKDYDGLTPLDAIDIVLDYGSEFEENSFGEELSNAVGRLKFLVDELYEMRVVEKSLKSRIYDSNKALEYIKKCPLLTYYNVWFMNDNIQVRSGDKCFLAFHFITNGRAVTMTYDFIEGAIEDFTAVELIELSNLIKNLEKCFIVGNSKLNLSRAALDIELEDDNTSIGGISFVGYTLRDFLEETDIEFSSLEELNKALIKGGIKPLDKNIIKENE